MDTFFVEVGGKLEHFTGTSLSSPCFLCDGAAAFKRMLLNAELVPSFDHN